MATETYLSAIVEKAKEMLPKDFFNEMVKKARSKAGGKRKAELDKITLSDMTPEVLKSADKSKVNDYWRKANKYYAIATKENMETEEIVGAARHILKEMDKRGMKCDERLELYQKCYDGYKVKKSFDETAQLPKNAVVLRDLVSFVASGANANDDTSNLQILLNGAVANPGGDIVIKAEDIWAGIRNVIDPDKVGLVSFVDNPESTQSQPLYDLALVKKDTVPSVVAKGFESGEPDGGSHAHAIDRYQKTTVKDGAHCHVFLLPDGQTLWTSEDGIHTHGLEESYSELSGPEGSAHKHTLNCFFKVETADFTIEPGTVIETEYDGEHSHANLFETTGFGGTHTHKLMLPDGSTVESLTPGDYYRLMGPFRISPQPLPPASHISRALNELKWRKMEIEQMAKQACVPCDPVPACTPCPEAKVEIAPDVLLALAAVGIGESALVIKEFEALPKDEASSAPADAPEIEVPIMKADNEKRIVYGAVMKAETTDKQGDEISFDELEDAASHYLSEERHVAFRHKEALSTKNKAKVVASIVMKAGDVFYGEKLEYGTWILGVKIEDDELWEMVKEGQISAFSPGGYSLRRPIP